TRGRARQGQGIFLRIDENVVKHFSLNTCDECFAPFPRGQVTNVVRAKVMQELGAIAPRDRELRSKWRSNEHGAAACRLVFGLWIAVIAAQPLCRLGGQICNSLK